MFLVSHVPWKILCNLHSFAKTENESVKDNLSQPSVVHLLFPWGEKTEIHLHLHLPHFPMYLPNVFGPTLHYTELVFCYFVNIVRILYPLNGCEIDKTQKGHWDENTKELIKMIHINECLVGSIVLDCKHLYIHLFSLSLKTNLL